MNGEVEVLTLADEISELEEEIKEINKDKKFDKDKKEKKKREKKKKLKKKKEVKKFIDKQYRAFFVVMLVILAFILILLESYIITSFDWKYHENPGTHVSTPVVIPKIKIYNMESNTRPIAVMINNHNKARPNHSGLSDAYVIYEFIVEGGLTRYMALFKDKNIERIGSVRSSRHYFLDYAMEHDAIYTHFGWSPQAERDIRLFRVNNINGMVDGGFFRDKTLGVPSEHTAFISIEKIIELSNKRKYRLTTEVEPVLNYVIKKQYLNELEIEGVEAMPANKVSVNYSAYVTSSYVYDSESMVYKRYVNGVEHTDGITKEQYTFKNIIVYQVANYADDSYGRQGLNNVGSGMGYYVTNGYAIPITWEKSSRSSQTIYRYTNGVELDVNDGNTFIQVQPKGRNLSITE